VAPLGPTAQAQGHVVSKSGAFAFKYFSPIYDGNLAQKQLKGTEFDVEREETSG
jgi:hypothetical protein